MFQIHFGNEVSRIQANVCQFFFHRRSENPFGRVYRSTGNSGEILVHRFGSPWRHNRRFGCFVRKVQFDTSKNSIYFFEFFSLYIFSWNWSEFNFTNFFSYYILIWHLFFFFFSSSRNGWCPPSSRRSALTIASKCMSSATNINLSLSRPLLLRHWMKIGSITKILLISWTWWKIVPMLFWKSWAGFKKSTNANLLSWMVSNPGLWTFKKSSNYKFQKIGFKRNKALNYFSLWKAFFLSLFSKFAYIFPCV